MGKAELNADELNLDNLNSFTLLNESCDIGGKVLHTHTEKIVLSICTLRLLSDQVEDLDLKMELVSMLYQIKLSDNPNIPTLFKGIGRALGKYLSVESEFVAGMIEEKHMHETAVSEILTTGYELYENSHLSGVRLVDLLDQVRHLDYQDILETAQENGKTAYLPKIINRDTYSYALNKLQNVKK